MGYIRARWLYWDKSCCIRAKVVVLGMCSSIQEKVAVFGQSGCVRAKNGCNQAKWLYSGKSGCALEKDFVFRQKWLYSG